MAAKASADDRASPYRDLVRRSAWRRWTAASASCRLPIAMAPLALVLVGRGATGSFATGALMASAYTFAEALSALAAGRLVARFADLRRGLSASLAGAVVVLLGLGAAALLSWPAAALIALSATAGALPSAAPGGLRAMLERLVAPELRQVAFALDATLLEIEYLGGPALVGLATLAGAPIAAIATMAAASLGALAMIQALPRQPASRPTTQAAAGSPWRNSAALSSYGRSLLLGYAEGTLTLTLAPLLTRIGGTTAEAGFLLAGLSAASAVGGFGYSWLASRLPAPSPRRTDLLLVIAGLLLFPLSVARSVGALSIAIVGFGLLIAPINALRTYQLGEALPEHQHTDGFSILYGAMGIGVGISGLASAAMLHAAGPELPFTVAAIVVLACMAASAALSALRKRRPSAA